MTTETPAAVDWRRWLERWERQQTGYLPAHEERFTAMFDALAALLPEQFTFIDLAGGPGSLSRRLLDRFPAARGSVVDYDPLLLALGQEALGTYDGRLRWVEADLNSADWWAALGEERVDAVLSTTALHWLPAGALVRLYRELGTLIRPGGLFLNGDNLAFGADLPAFQALAQRQRETLWSEASFAARGIESWRGWWEAVAAEPALADLKAERDRRFAWMPTAPPAPGFDLHVAALRDAGFGQVGVIWQQGANRVLLAVR